MYKNPIPIITAFCFFSSTAGFSAGIASTTQPPKHISEVSETLWSGTKSYTVTDGYSEAVVVPSWGRIMRYGRVHGPNILWVAPDNTLQSPGFKNRGGSKLWPAPQAEWTAFTPDTYPPDKSWDGATWSAKVTRTSAGSGIHISSGFWNGIGLQATTDIAFADDGTLVIDQSFSKLSGEPRRVALWRVTQVNPPDSVYTQSNQNTALSNGYFWFFDGPKPEYVRSAAKLADGAVQIIPSKTDSFKLGLDTQTPTIVSISGGNAFVMSTPYVTGHSLTYPDGPDAHGFPVELYNQGGDGVRYDELELLSPLYTLHKGESCHQTTRWSIFDLSPSESTESQAISLLKNALPVTAK